MALDAGRGACQGGATGAAVLMGSNVAKWKMSALTIVGQERVVELAILSKEMRAEDQALA